MNSELKPCPFCGKNELTMGRSFVSGNKGKYKNQYYIVWYLRFKRSKLAYRKRYSKRVEQEGYR